MTSQKSIRIWSCGKLWLFCICCCMSLSFVMAQSTQMKNTNAYYLSSAGNDHNQGTLNSPWQTIKKINSIPLLPGDQVLFRGGDTFKGHLIAGEASVGMEGNPVLITSFGKGKAIIDGGNGIAVEIINTRFISIKNLTLKGNGRKNGNTTDGMVINHCSDVVVDNLEITGFQKAGLLVYASASINVTKIAAYNNGFAGISVSGKYQEKESCSNIYIGYCNAYNNPGSPVVLDNHSGNGIIAGNCSKVAIEYCTATNNGWDMPRKGNGPVGIWCYEADSITIQHCLSYRNKTSKGGEDGGGFDLDGGVTNSVIQYCLSYENHGSGFGIFQYAGASVWRNNTIRFNISENDGAVSAAGAGVYIWNSSDDSTQFADCFFYNNTIYNDKGAAISYARQSLRKGFLFYNNIFVARDNLLKGEMLQDRFLANNWWSVTSQFSLQGFNTLAEWANRSGKEMLDGNLKGLNFKPDFSNSNEQHPTHTNELALLNKFKIPVNSPLQNSGLDLKAIFGIENGGVDFSGKPAPEKGIGTCF